MRDLSIYLSIYLSVYYLSIYLCVCCVCLWVRVCTHVCVGVGACIHNTDKQVFACVCVCLLGRDVQVARARPADTPAGTPGADMLCAASGNGHCPQRPVAGPVCSKVRCLRCQMIGQEVQGAWSPFRGASGGGHGGRRGRPFRAQSLWLAGSHTQNTHLFHVLVEGAAHSTRRALSHLPAVWPRNEHEHCRVLLFKVIN